MSANSAIGAQTLGQSVGTTGAPLLSLQKLDKRFGATHALKAVDLSFDEGEIHAIVGEKRRRQIDPDQAAHRRPHPLRRRHLLARPVRGFGEPA
jgi:hypothetical protein